MKLAKMLLNFATTEIAGVTWMHDTELAVGVEVYIEDENGEFKPVADGEYTKDDVVYKVENGVITEIETKEPEPEPEPEPEKLEEEPQKPTEIEVLQTRVNELETLLEEKEATINDLNAKIEALTTEIETLKNKPVEEPVKMKKTPRTAESNNNPALKFFENK